MLRLPLILFSIPALVLVQFTSVPSSESSSWAEGSVGAGIITRHDRTDADFVRLGNEFTDSICDLNINPKAPDCMATFVEKRWIITAGHCAVLITSKLNAGQAHQIRFRERLFSVEKVLFPPGYSASSNRPDIALIKLKQRADGAKVLPIYTATDELSREIVVAGYGDFGTGVTGPAGNDGKLRAGTNKVDEVTEEWLSFRFDAPQSPNVTAYEAISGPGDSGGPAFIRRGKKLHIAGISSRQSTRATGGNEGVYGVTEYFTRVSSYRNWARDTIRRQ